MHRIPQLNQFEGQWSLRRLIRDRFSDSEGHLTGTATFTPDPEGGLTYFEEGELHYAGQPPVTATRRYHWSATPDGIAVHFDDGRPFHVIEADRLMPDAMHHCDPDMYHVSYDFTAWPGWRAMWRVVGPRKDYRMMTEYLRA